MVYKIVQDHIIENSSDCQSTSWLPRWTGIHGTRNPKWLECLARRLVWRPTCGFRRVACWYSSAFTRHSLTKVNRKLYLAAQDSGRSPHAPCQHQFQGSEAKLRPQTGSEGGGLRWRITSFRTPRHHAVSEEFLLELSLNEPQKSETRSPIRGSGALWTHPSPTSASTAPARLCSLGLIFGPPSRTHMRHGPNSFL